MGEVIFEAGNGWKRLLSTQVLFVFHDYCNNLSGVITWSVCGWDQDVIGQNSWLLDLSFQSSWLLDLQRIKKVAILPYYLIDPLIFVAQCLSWFLDQLFEKVHWSPGSVWSRVRALWQAAHKWLHLACGQETVYLNQLIATLIPHLPL